MASERDTERFRDALMAICGKRPGRAIVMRWNQGIDYDLQQWAYDHRPLTWATGIGVLDAAQALVDAPMVDLDGNPGNDSI